MQWRNDMMSFSCIRASAASEHGRVVVQADHHNLKKKEKRQRMSADELSFHRLNFYQSHKLKLNTCTLITILHQHHPKPKKEVEEQQNSQRLYTFNKHAGARIIVIVVPMTTLICCLSRQ